MLGNAGETVICLEENGFYQHPSDCQKYFQCAYGVAYEYTCHNGTLWNDKLKFCDWKENVDCNLSGSESESITTTVSTSTASETTILLPEESCPGTFCGLESLEPITEEVKTQRETATCHLVSDQVNSIVPLSSANPQNVKNVEAIFPETMFNEFFPERNSAYTYSNFLKAIGKYPSICSSASLCPKILANMFGHIQQETANLVYLEEIIKSPYCKDDKQWLVDGYPCVTGQMYYGRGSKQLSWNYNYGAFSNAMFGDAMVLLNNPDLVASTWLNFAASMWFFVTPQPPKPSMLQVLDGTWNQNSHDMASNLIPGFGVTTMIINGEEECRGWSQEAENRAAYYTEYAKQFNVNIEGEKLLCNDMHQFSEEGSTGSLALYWAPESSCSLVTWQTAFSALIEGNYNRCQGLTPQCSNENEVTVSTTTTTEEPVTSTLTPESITTSTTTIETSTSPSDLTDCTVICVDAYGFYPNPCDCKKYYQCADSVAYGYTCQDGTLWNDELNYCDWEKNVDCNSASSESESTTTTSEIAETTEPASSESTECTETTSMKVVCYYSTWPYYREGKSIREHN